MIRVGQSLEIEFHPARGDDADHWEVYWRVSPRRRKRLGYAVTLQGACRIATNHALTLPERGAQRKAIRSLEEAILELQGRVAQLACTTGPGGPAKAAPPSQETTSPGT